MAMRIRTASQFPTEMPPVSDLIAMQSGQSLTVGEYSGRDGFQVRVEYHQDPAGDGVYVTADSPADRHEFNMREMLHYHRDASDKPQAAQAAWDAMNANWKLTRFPVRWDDEPKVREKAWSSNDYKPLTRRSQPDPLEEAYLMGPWLGSQKANRRTREAFFGPFRKGMYLDDFLNSIRNVRSPQEFDRIAWEGNSPPFGLLHLIPLPQFKGVNSNDVVDNILTREEIAKVLVQAGWQKVLPKDYDRHHGSDHYLAPGGTQPSDVLVLNGAGYRPGMARPDMPNPEFYPPGSFDRRLTSKKTAAQSSVVCPRCGASVSPVEHHDLDAMTKTLHASCQKCGWYGTKGPVPMRTGSLASSLRQAALASQIKVSAEDEPVRQALASLKSLDDEVGGVSGKAIVGHLLATATMDERTRRELTALADPKVAYGENLDDAGARVLSDWGADDDTISEALEEFWSEFGGDARGWDVFHFESTLLDWAKDIGYIDRDYTG